MIQLKFSRLTISKFNDSSKLTTAGKKIFKKDYKCNFIKMGENEKTQANSLLAQRPRLPVCGESLPLQGKKGECNWMEGISVFLPRAWERAAYSQGQNRTFGIDLK